MKAVIQRVSEASVSVEGEVVGEIGAGVLVLLGVHQDDTGDEIPLLADKLINLRIFEDDAGKLNLSLLDTGGAALVVSQFTLLGDCRKGRRPSFNQAARPDKAVPFYEQYCAALRERGVTVATGRFGAMMDVRLVNDGPVTILLDSDELRRPRRG